LLQRTTLESLPSQPRLSFNMENIDDVFPGFALGDFAVLHGSPAVLPLSTLLCVRAQLPPQLGGLGTNVTFVDGGNTFRLYDVSTIAQLHELDPKEVLERIFISRAFTAYQMTSIVFDRLRETVERYGSKLVVVSDIAGLYLDRDVPEREAKHVFSQLTLRLSRFAEENRVTVVATYPPHYPSKRNLFLKWAACGRAGVVASVKPTRRGSQFVLEKHPLLPKERAAFPSENLTLNRFLGA
jgi:NAD(P)-dependent dehydrogenase (short-subunit alcohol dehydrogenase family)